MENKDISIVLFAYNFPHKKTQDFIFRILAEGYQIQSIYAADAIKLNIPPSTVKTKINHIGLIHPKLIADAFGIRYIVTDHNNELIIKENKDTNNLAIISGARILNAKIVDVFSRGIINFHPGIIPFARGLDALLWSIYKDLPLGVTAHLIDKRIDAGKILKIEQMLVYSSDGIFDLSERLYEMQLDMIPTTIQIAANNGGYFIEDYGQYNRKMPGELEKQTLEKYPEYISKLTS
jgi:phosphoribosylglycinamide formyltransferase-1